MERRDNVLDNILDDENIEDFEDVEMMDVEDGEIVGQDLNAESSQCSEITDVKTVSMECHNDNPGQSKSKRKKNKKKKRKRGSSGPNVIDVNRFVIDVCRRLKERKSYLVWTAVGCLGVSAFSDLVKEVEAIQACGGQKTADGGRYRSGGGILWNILKSRDPNAYKEIMRKGKEFEKQLFKPRNIQEAPQKGDSSRTNDSKLTEQSVDEIPNGLKQSSHVQNQFEQPKSERKLTSVHDRVRIPVAYDDLLEGEIPEDQET